ncbi:histidine kinase [Herbiconiux sp. CPCC 205716]|uniref:histidine kinase n=1 Tax=Herbiconiux gentiana TaxID=2970912 RepID=A0ABT2GHA1_9MICO|nr:histidine kinase [Herbiconiux gentiana]MCS5715604.1 histidine kinase [Herbiconiux gentiana]
MSERTDRRPGSPLAALRRADARVRANPRLEDALTAAVVFLLGTALIALGVTGTWSDAPTLVETPWAHLGPLAVACAAMLAKRRHPLTMLLVGVAATVADGMLGGSIGVVLALFDLLFAAWLFTTPAGRRLITRTVVVVLVGITVASVLSGAPPRVTVLLVLQAVALVVLPLWWAANVQQKSELAELAEERARLETERADALAREAEALRLVADGERTEAVRGERARMARDLHDTIAGQVSVIAIQAEASLAREPDPARDRQALAVVRESALESLQEMRQLIGLLRGAEADPWATAPGLEGLGAVVERARRAGVDVSLAGGFDGGVDFARVGAPSAAEQAAVRIVQEALVNAGKHAPGCAATVAVRQAEGPPRLVVEVRSALGRSSSRSSTDPASAESLHTAHSGGIGVEVMRERARALGGFAVIGRHDEEWVVHAELPTTRLRGGA